jgi:riboflavin biosynthesis pyrimidine reductase
VTVFHRAGVPAERRKGLAAAGATLVTIPSGDDGRPAIAAALTFLAEAGVNHLLVEAGTGLATGFMQAGAINRIYWTQSTHILGGDALPAVGSHAISHVNDMAFSPETKYTLSRQQMIGDDHLLILEKPAL